MQKQVLVLGVILCCSLSVYGQAREFPEDFLFGTATSAYQIEGAWNTGGKGENIWDRYTHTHPEFILDRSTGDIACDSYHKLHEDVALLKEMKVKFYRFSLSWSRILPKGFAYKINPDGIRYYNQLIDLLLENDIMPMVTLFHWDTPQPLEDLGGFTNSLFPYWFEEYAKVAFDHFGDRVKLWLTFNEPKQTCFGGYGGDNKAPGYMSSGIGDYLCAHNVLKAHARAYHLYDTEYRKSQNGRVGITIDTMWFEPNTDTEEDRAAAERYIQFLFGWYADPIFRPGGDYPQVMKDMVAARSEKEGFSRSRLPTFNQTEIDYIQGTYDFFGLNHYSTYLAENIEDAPIGDPSLDKDARCRTWQDSSWPSSSEPWLKVVPWGFTNLLKWIKNRYGDVEIYITENGFADFGELEDTGRINYYNGYLNAVLDAMIDHKVNVKAYTAWSLLDNFEWKDGYVNRFGLHHVDFNDPERPRTAKASAKYFTKVVETRKVNVDV